jgi:hypothetical protein
MRGVQEHDLLRPDAGGARHPGAGLLAKSRTQLRELRFIAPGDGVLEVLSVKSRRRWRPIVKVATLP